MLYVVLYVLIFLLWMGAELLLAPKGFQDKKGFHYGAPKVKRYKRYNRRLGQQYP